MRAFLLFLCGLLLSLAGLSAAQAHGSASHQGATMPAHSALHGALAPDGRQAGSIPSQQEDVVHLDLPRCASMSAPRTVEPGTGLSLALRDCGELSGHCCHAACAVLPAALLSAFALDAGHAVPPFLSPPPSRGRVQSLFRPPRAMLA